MKTIRHFYKPENIIIIGLGGPSSSGKSTSAKAMHILFEKSILVHLDDFYFPDNQIPIDAKTKEQNWDCLEAIDFNKFFNYIIEIKKGNIESKIDSLEIDTSLKLCHCEEEYFKSEIGNKGKLEEKLIVFVDGFMLYHDPKIIELLDIKLFFYASFKTLKERRESRKGYNTVEGFWVDPPNYFTNIVWPEFERSHKYLFENEDIDSKLNDYARNTLQICSYKNEIDTTLFELINWSLKTILDKL